MLCAVVLCMKPASLWFWTNFVACEVFRSTSTVQLESRHGLCVRWYYLIEEDQTIHGPHLLRWEEIKDYVRVFSEIETQVCIEGGMTRKTH